jgi:hypothetical protein
MELWANTFTAQFDAWCRGCNDDISEGDFVGFIVGEKGIHCWYCIFDYALTKTDEQDDNG